MSCLPQNYRDKVEFANPKTMEEAIRQEKLRYTQFKQMTKLNKTCQNKKKGKLEHRKKGFKPSSFRLSRNYKKGVTQ